MLRELRNYDCKYSYQSYLVRNTRGIAIYMPVDMRKERLRVYLKSNFKRKKLISCLPGPFGNRQNQAIELLTATT